jgi:hypothetical protein
VLQNDGKKTYIIQENAKRLAVKKIKWWVLEETGAANLKKNTHTCTCTKRNRIERQGVAEHQKTETEKRNNDSKCDTYITRGP